MTTTPTPQYKVKRSSFWKIVAIALAVIAGLGLLIHQLNAGHHRPEGIAERWLSAVSETGRNGVKSNARERAEEIGPVSLAAPLFPTDHDPKHGYFKDLEVGKAIDDGPDTVRVPFQLHRESESDPSLEKGAVVLKKSGDEWKVTAVTDRRPGEKVPSEGGEPPSSAPLGLWIGALALGVLLAGGTALIVHYADRTAQRAMAQPAKTG